MTTLSVRGEQTLEISPIFQASLIYSYKKQSVKLEYEDGPKENQIHNDTRKLHIRLQNC